jgi:hypothetical protein
MQIEMGLKAKDCMTINSGAPHAIVCCQAHFGTNAANAPSGKPEFAESGSGYENTTYGKCCS